MTFSEDFSDKQAFGAPNTTSEFLLGGSNQFSCTATMTDGRKLGQSKNCLFSKFEGGISTKFQTHHHYSEVCRRIQNNFRLVKIIQKAIRSANPALKNRT